MSSDRGHHQEATRLAAWARKRGKPRRFVRAAAGFTLVEALIALLLMAFVLPVAMHAIARSAQLGVETGRRAEAAALAHDRMAEVVMRREWETGGARGTFTEDQAADPGVFRWELRVDDWEGSLLFREVEVVVWWQERRHEKSYTLTTLVTADGGAPSADTEADEAEAGP